MSTESKTNAHNAERSTSQMLGESGFDSEATSKQLSAPAFQLKASENAEETPVQRKAATGGLPNDLVDGFANSTGHDLSDVNVHYNSSKPSQVGALAYAQGNDIHLGAGQEQHLAHEAAHVVQQREGRVQATTEVAGMPVNDNQSLESEADSMGANAMQMKSANTHATGNLNGGNLGSPLQRKENGQNLPKQLAKAGNVIQAKVDTSGGIWDTSIYETQDFRFGAKNQHGIGAKIKLEFEPNGLVEADDIGLTQSVKTMKSTAADPTNTNESSTVSDRNKDLSLTAAEGDEGRAIDQGDNSVVPNTNPFYAVENTAAKVSASLDDVTPAVGNGFGEHASRKKVGDKFETKKGWLGDGPAREVEFPGQQYDQSFEVTALVLNGPLTNTYLGSVEWGWSSNAAGVPSIKPLKIVRSGAPSSAFMKAAGKWNDAQFDQGGKKYDTVNLPLTTIESATKAPNQMTEQELRDRYKLVVAELAKIDAAKNPNDMTNLAFEKRALDLEFTTRNLNME
jgi:hypothetical protein